MPVHFFIMSVHLFESLSKKINISISQFDQFLKYTSTKSVGRNDFLLRAGQVCREMVFVKKGVLCTYQVDQKGEKHVLQIALQNHWIADLFSLFAQTPTQYYIQALEATEVIALKLVDFEQACEQLPILERFFRLLIQDGYVAAQRRISGIYSATADQRYEELVRGHRDLVESIPQHYIASYLGIKPQSLSRIRKQMAQRDKG